MNITELAKQADKEKYFNVKNKFFKAYLERFAALVRAEALEEAEEIAKTIGGSFSVEFLAAIRGLK